jgi:hypothetical protein
VCQNLCNGAAAGTAAFAIPASVEAATDIDAANCASAATAIHVSPRIACGNFPGNFLSTLIEYILRFLSILQQEDTNLCMN